MTKKYGGTLVYSTNDEHGPIEVVEFQQTLRGLHFGNSTQQSGMFLYNPIVLIHKYTQAMLVSLAWAEPHNVLALGLGAGSIPKHLLHYYPNVNIDAVELRPKVTEIATDYFSLPVTNKRLNITHCSAHDFLTTKINKQYDLVFIDLFLTANEKDIIVTLEDHLNNIFPYLSEEAYININIIGGEFNNYAGLETLKSHFENNLYSIEVEDSNTILFAAKGRIPTFDEIDFTTIEKKLGLPLRQWYNKMALV